MDFQRTKSWDNLMSIFDSKLPIRDAWNKIIDFHEQITPKPYWTTLRQLDFESEQIEIKNWLEQIVITSPLPKSVIALWIGILKFAGEDEDDEIPAIYLIGAGTYDKNDIEWACDPIYFPKNKYTRPPVLKQIESIIKDDDDNYCFFDWLLPLAYCALTLDEIIRTKLDKKLFLGTNDRLFVSTGHDSGDYLDISNIE